MRKIYCLLIAITFFMVGCEAEFSRTVPATNSGVIKAEANVKTGSDGLTTEQRNVKKRVEEDNKPGAIKHLYVISSYTGKVLQYSTVDGKVTSSPKRLNPNTVAAVDGQYVDSEMNGIDVEVNRHTHRTAEVLSDDGTYGSSIPYIYWWDTNGNYHQLYATGGQLITIEDNPLPIPMEGVVNLSGK